MHLARKEMIMTTLHKAILNTDTAWLSICGAVAHILKSTSLVMCLLMQ